MPDANLDADHWYILNVFTDRPPDNDLRAWTVNKTEAKRMGLDWRNLGAPLQKRYLLPQYRDQVALCRSRLEALNPDLIVGLGATALWFLTGESAITSFRGTFFPSPFGGDAICTFHPASILYQWPNYPIAWADLTKVRDYLTGSLPPPAKRVFYVNPSFNEISYVYHCLLSTPSVAVGVDLETAPSIAQITTCSFSTPNLGICIPIWDRYATADPNYWSVADEVMAWRWIDKFAQLPNPKVLQNGLYDTQYLLAAPIPIRLRNYGDDTSILQHSLQPELLKDLGTLASLYLNEPAWKFMRKSAKDAKVDE